MSAAKEARNYLEKHNLLVWMQELMQDLSALVKPRS